MKTYKTKKEIKLKTGEVIPVGSDVTLKEVIKDGKLVLLDVPILNRELKIRVISFVDKILGKKSPSHNQLERWNDDGYCMTPTGFKVEPDGTGPDGIPSWMRVLELI